MTILDHLKHTTPVASTQSADSVKLLVNGEDHTGDILSELGEEFDGFDVIKTGSPATIAVFASDHNHHTGGYCAYFDGTTWKSVFWSQVTGYELY